MSLIIGKQRSVSLSCLVRSSIEMPANLEARIKNLDDVFLEQLTTYREASAYITTALEHEFMGPWQQISNIQDFCETRVKVISADYIRATSYGSMRIINTRMTDVLIVIKPVKNFMEFAIKRCEEELARNDQLEGSTGQGSSSTSDGMELVEMANLSVETSSEILEEDTPEENNLLLNENLNKPNEYEEHPKRRDGGLLSCFGF